MCYYTSEMACPYFQPVERRLEGLGPASAILPLGDAWSGVCRASAGAPWQPGDAQLQSLCSFGYARGRCDRFPQDDSGPDAVRFTINQDDDSSIGLYYVQERDHHPFAHGPLEYSQATNRFLQQPGDEILACQAEAYIRSYLRRRTEALAR